MCSVLFSKDFERQTTRLMVVTRIDEGANDESRKVMEKRIVVPAVPGYDPQRAEGVIGSRLEATASVRDE